MTGWKMCCPQFSLTTRAIFFLEALLLIITQLRILFQRAFRILLNGRNEYQ